MTRSLDALPVIGRTIERAPPCAGKPGTQAAPYSRALWGGAQALLFTDIVMIDCVHEIVDTEWHWFTTGADGMRPPEW
jgi:hypothetical protein